MKILTFNEYINESVSGENTVKILGDIVMLKIKNDYDDEDFKYILDETDYLVSISSYDEIIHMELPSINIKIGKPDIVKYSSEIDKRILKILSLYPLEIKLTYAKNAGLDDNANAYIELHEEYSPKDIKIYVNGDNETYDNIDSLRSYIVHELKHYYDYIISKGKIFTFDSVKISDSSDDIKNYLNSPEELSARLTQFIDKNREKIESGKMDKISLYNSLLQFALYNNEKLKNKSIRWALKKAIGLINQIQKTDNRIDISGKINNIASKYNLDIKYEKFYKYSPYIIKNGILKDDALTEITRLCDIYRYDLGICKNVDVNQIDDLARYNIKKLSEDVEEELMLLLSLPSDTVYYRENKRKK